MKFYGRPHAPGGAYAIFVVFCFYLPSVGAGMLTDTEWKVTRGDTLYAIGRAVYPGDARQQARLRRDIMKLNPSIFANGANNMSVGIVLKLPNYVAPKSTPSLSGRRPEPAPRPDKPSVRAETFSGTGWKVMLGDTLYMICRTIYPGDGRKQARLGWDIKKLNPSVFANGNNILSAGTVLKLPAYVPTESVPSRAGGSAPAPAPDKVTPEPIQQPAQQPVQQPVAPAPIVKPPRKATTATHKEQSSSSQSLAESDVVVSLGYSYGGDKLVNVGGGPDIFAGSGVQLRLGYEQMFQNGSGYRASLGFQYYTLAEQTDVSFSDSYVQLAYQYRANPVVYGIGVISDAGATLNSDATTKYDAATGAIVYLEYVGKGKLEGWGLSVTSMDIKEKNSGTSVDASRTELYYNWRF